MNLFVTPCSKIRGFFYTSPKLDGIVIRVTFLDNVTYITYEIDSTQIAILYLQNIEHRRPRIVLRVCTIYCIPPITIIYIGSDYGRL